MKRYLIFIAILFSSLCLPFLGRAQCKCDSVVIIKVLDSLTHRPLRYARVTIDYSEKYARNVQTNRRGIAKFYFKDSDRLDIKKKQYSFTVFPDLGYHYKENIRLMPDLNCEQRVYLRKWTKEEEKRIIKTISVKD